MVFPGVLRTKHASLIEPGIECRKQIQENYLKSRTLSVYRYN